MHHEIIVKPRTNPQHSRTRLEPARVTRVTQASPSSPVLTVSGHRTRILTQNLETSDATMLRQAPHGTRLSENPDREYGTAGFKERTRLVSYLQLVGERYGAVDMFATNH